MQSRGITEAQIEQVLESPNITVHTPENSIRYERTFPNGRTLKVWVVRNDKTNKPQVVKSAAWKGEDDE